MCTPARAKLASKTLIHTFGYDSLGVVFFELRHMIFIFVTSPCTGVVVVVVGVVVFPFGKPSVGSYTFLEFIIVIMLLPPQKPTATEPELFTPKKKDKKRNIIIHPP